jgi:hypothetical protein
MADSFRGSPHVTFSGEGLRDWGRQATAHEALAAEAAEMLADLLHRAGEVFSLAGQLGQAFHRERVSPVFAVGPAVFQRHALLFDAFCAALLDLRDAMQNPPDGFAPVAQHLLQAAKLAKGIRDTLARDGGFTDYLDYRVELTTVCQTGWEAVKAVTKARRLDDPFAFVDEPATPAFSLLDRFPATPAGHVAFLEWVREEVHHVVESKRLPLDQRYPNATIEKRVRGIKWAEALARLAALSNLPEGVRAKVGHVLRRELTVGTVEQIDALLEPAVWGVRDAWEQARQVEDADPEAQANTAAAQGEPAEATSETSTTTKPKRSTQRGDGRAKLIAALTKHHQYADGGCLNLEPIGNNKLARLAGVSESTASGFFTTQFDGHTKYRASCANATLLVASLKVLNQEFSPHHLFGSNPPSEDRQDDGE